MIFPIWSRKQAKRLQESPLAIEKKEEQAHLELSRPSPAGRVTFMLGVAYKIYKQRSCYTSGNFASGRNKYQNAECS